MSLQLRITSSIVWILPFLSLMSSRPSAYWHSEAIVTPGWCYCMLKAYVRTCAQSMMTHGAGGSKQMYQTRHIGSHTCGNVCKKVRAHTHIMYSHIHATHPNHVHNNIHACDHTYTTHMYSCTQVHTCTHTYTTHITYIHMNSYICYTQNMYSGTQYL